MVDILDRLAGPATDLLGRVDDLLARAGAPDGHRIWPLLRRVGALPGEAAGAVIALRPAPVTAAGRAVRQVLPAYADLVGSLAAEVDWTGAGADAFHARRAALAGRLVGDRQSLAGRVESTAGYAEALAEWARRSRAALGVTVAESLGSAEAVEVLTGADRERSPGPALAGAEIGARVLATVADIVAEGADLLARHAPELTELPYPTGPGRPDSGGGGRLDGPIRVVR